ncbi:MAG: PIG-L family deacetylase [Anaerolineales bacterium]|nr:PIG-L family deacetylase [Anaerolineales bacterium]
MEEQFSSPQKVLVIVAHPDDPEFGCAGTVAHWTAQGVEVVYVIVTDGDKGTSDLTLTPQALAGIRIDEQIHAARVLGVNEIQFLHHHDGEIFNTHELRGEIVEQIRKYRPDVVITTDPTTFITNNNRINHPDHRNIGEVVLDAVFPLARDHLNYPEQIQAGLQPHKVNNILLQFTDQANIFFDITETIDTKLAALAEHHSQLGEYPQVVLDRMRERSRTTAEHLPYEYAEAFRWISLPT